MTDEDAVSRLARDLVDVLDSADAQQACVQELIEHLRNNARARILVTVEDLDRLHKTVMRVRESLLSFRRNVASTPAFRTRLH